MKLDDILSVQFMKVAEVQDSYLMFLNGSVEPDHDSEHFRLYRVPSNRCSYFLIKKNDVLGDLYEWSVEEVTRSGLVGVKMHRVPLRAGSEIQIVSITIEKLGETISDDPAIINFSDTIVGTCRGSSCNSGCCTEKGNGKCSCNNCCVAVLDQL